MSKTPALVLASLSPEERTTWLSTLSDEQAAQLRWTWSFFARPNQLHPPGDWLVWFIKAGRGWGKTRTGAEWVRHQVEEQGRKRIALVAATAADTRDVMVEGVSGLLSVCPPWNKPEYEPSKRRLTWPNGAIATMYSADEPNRLRGPQHDAAWCDELAAWRYTDAWDQLRFGLRLGDKPRVVVTTTPRPTELIRELLKESTTVLTSGTTHENKENLAEDFFTQIVKKYENTRLGRQEIYADILNDVPGALWQRSTIDQYRVTEPPDLAQVLVGVDPAVTSGDKADETGIILFGVDENQEGYVLGDFSGRYTPDVWAAKAVDAYHQYRADRIVAEVNNGGDLVEKTIRTVDPRISFKSVRATRGKYTRAEPVAALYEQGKMHHVGMFAKLEDQMCIFTPGAMKKSPDRVDALVWAATDAILDNQSYLPDISLNLDVGLKSESWRY